MRHDHSAAPLLLALAGTAVLTGMDALVKFLSASFPTFQIVLLRYAMMVLWMLGPIALMRPGWPLRARLPAHAGRAALNVLTAGTFFYALGRLPLAEVFALSFTSPIFIAMFGALLLGERLRWRVVVAIAAGFAGMLVIVAAGAGSSAGGPAEPLAIAAALAAPVTYALGIVLLRAQTAHEPPMVIVFVQGVLVLLFVAPIAAIDLRPPQGTDWLAFALVGLFGAVGHLAFAHALARTTAARFSVAEYTGLLWAALFGYVFFAEVPTLNVWVGAALIVAGCLLVLRQRAPAPRPSEAQT